MKSIPSAPPSEFPPLSALPQVDRRVAERLFARIRTGDLLLLAFSGGPDSTALLLMLKALAAATGRFSLSAFYLNHRLRSPDECRLEADFVRRITEAYHLPLYTAEAGEGELKTLAVREGVGLEAAARALRYRELAKTADALRKTAPSVWAVTAHHRDDWEETLCMRWLTSASVKGLCGISERDGLLRPLLDVRRSEIECWLKRAGVKAIDDTTNGDLHYFRNSVRRQLLPVIRQVAPSFSVNAGLLAQKMELQCQANDFYLASFWNRFKEGSAANATPAAVGNASRAGNTAAENASRAGDAPAGTGTGIGTAAGVPPEALISAGGEAVFYGPSGFSFPYEWLSCFPLALQIDLVMSLWNRIRDSGGGEVRLPWRGLRDTLQAMQEKPRSGVCLFRKGWMLSLEGQRLRLQYTGAPAGGKPVPDGFCLQWQEAELRTLLASLPRELEVGGGRVVLHRASSLPTGKGVFIPESALTRSLVIRSRRPGDTLVSSAGRRRLKKLLNGWKLPSELRSQVPIIEINGEIVGVLGSLFGKRDLVAASVDAATAPTGNKWLVILPKSVV